MSTPGGVANDGKGHGADAERPEGRPRRIIRAADDRRSGAGSGSRADQAYEYIRDRILSLKMAPGMVFTEGEIAAELEASKTPIREALVRLEHEGLVSSAPRSGYRVSPITLKDTRELGELRGMLLIEAAGRVATQGLTKEQEDELQRIVAAADAAVEERDPDAAAEVERLHREFDIAVARATENDWLTWTLSLIYDELRRVRVLSSRLATGSDPVQRVGRASVVLDAIRQRDAEAARSAMRERAEVGQQRTLMSLIESPAVMSANLAIGFDAG